jgi:diguanylate cyclase (GGDEF)-like protein
LPGHLRALVAAQCACWLGVPLTSHQGTIGVLALRSYSGDVPYTEQDQELLQFVSAQIATAVERKQLHEQLKYTARYDELTNLPNRRLLFDRLDTALARSRRNQGRMALLYVDLDRFKQVNDTFGHAAGDALLRGVAERLTRCVRDVDTVARIGGDEFVVLLENIQEPDHAAIVADRIRAELHQPVNFAERRLCATPSIGIALYPEHGDETQQLLRHADEAMYTAKKAATGTGKRASDRALPVTAAAVSRYKRRETDAS